MSAARKADSRRGAKKAKRQTVLIFGEDENDTKSIRELLTAMLPNLDGKIKNFARPPILIKDANPSDVPSRAQAIATLIEVEQVSSDVICVFAHEDCDKIEPAHEELAAKIETALADQGHHVHAVAPAWEMETWWFQWPDALVQVRPGWRSVDQYKNRNLGKIADSKEELRRALRPRGRTKVRDYSETDGPRIAQAVRELGIVSDRQGLCASFERFVESARSCDHGLDRM